MLQILREFSADLILCIYVIDDVWEYMKAMKVCYGFVKNRIILGFVEGKEYLKEKVNPTQPSCLAGLDLCFKH